MIDKDFIDRSFDGQLSEEEMSRLETAIIGDAELRSAYVEQRWLHAELIASCEDLPELLEEKPEAGFPRMAGWLSAAAAVAFFASTVYLISLDKSEPTVATLIEAENCRWSGSDLPTTEGAELGAGRLALTEGMATIRFDSGATVTLEAPTTLDIASSMRARLIEGSVVADVPESAHGFTIDTADTEVIDLGTRFGVTTTDLGSAHVFVFEGEVEVNQGENPETQLITEGGSMRIGEEDASLANAQVGEIARHASLSAPGDDWVAITTESGRGKDAYFRKTHSESFGSDPLIMVKETTLADTNRRKAALSFDLKRQTLSKVTDARLSLKIESSGLGFSSLVPDSEFVLYGVHDAALDKWEENGVNWSTSEPFAVLESPLAYESLATFTIRKGSPNGVVEMQSDKLTDFIASHSDNLLTFVLIRLTGENDKQGLVHAFASKEHPTSPAPTLWIQTSQK